MTWPTVRLTITSPEYSLLKPGLDFMACQLANAKLGLRTYRHPLERTDPEIANIYKRKQYSEEGDQTLISIRAKLWELTSSRKIRANFLELSAAALALRLLRLLPDSTYDSIAAKALAAKLEKYRKRAKTAAISRLGTEQHAAAAYRWQCFVQWVRYYLTYLHEPKRRSSCLRHIWAYQHSSLAELIAKMLSDFGYAPLSHLEMKRIVRLIKEEFRRGRHPLTLMELIRGTASTHQEFLFHVVAKKCELTPLPGVRYPMCVAAAQRAERFKNRQARKGASPAEPSPIPVTNSPDKQNLVPSGTFERESPKRLSFPEAVANWLREYVGPSEWIAVVSLALTRVAVAPPLRVGVPEFASLAELISKTRPAKCSSPAACYPVRDLASWLLTWMYGCTGFHAEVIAALKAGYGRATSQPGAQAA